MLGAAQQGSGSSAHFLTDSSAFTAWGKKNELANLQCHLFKGNKKEEWPAYLLSCWLQFSPSLLFFQDQASLGREKKRGAESTKPQQKSRISFPDFKPSNVKLHYCMALQREIRARLFIWRSHMSTVIKPHACFIRGLFHFSFQKFIPIQSGVWHIHKIPPPRPLSSLPGSPFANKIIDRKPSFLSNTALCSIKTRCWKMIKYHCT